MIIFLKWELSHHIFLGNLIGVGNEHTVYYKNGKDYVYKVYGEKITNVFKLIKVIKNYLNDRNNIPCLMPCKFVGIALCKKYIFPIFKLTKVEPLDKNYILPEGYKDVRPSNFGLYNGLLVAIDIKI